MKSLVALLFVSLQLIVFASVGLAQGVYVTQGENGPVFSDKPRAGAREVTLKPLNVVQPVLPDVATKGNAGEPNARSGREMRGTSEESAGPSVSPYRRFAIVSPEDNGSVAGDTSTFEVRLAIDPPLALAEGHAFVVRINGRFVEQRFTATEFMIPTGFWEDGYLSANQSLQLDASIVDGRGQIVVRAAPVTFRTLQIVFSPGYSPGRPAYVPLPVSPRHPVRPWPKPRTPKTGEESRTAAKPKAVAEPPFATERKDKADVRKNRGASRSDAGG